VTKEKASVSKSSTANLQEAVACFTELVRRVELMEIRLASTEARSSFEHLPSDDQECEVKIPPAEFMSGYDPDQSVAYCGVRFNLTARAPGEDISDFLNVSAEYDLFYRTPPDLRIVDEGLSLFASKNAVFNAWPFFRELVSSFVGRMDLPPVMVPLFRLPLAHPQPSEPTHGEHAVSRSSSNKK
jgi:hypothetical protein